MISLGRLIAAVVQGAILDVLFGPVDDVLEVRVDMVPPPPPVRS